MPITPSTNITAFPVPTAEVADNAAILRTALGLETATETAEKLAEHFLALNAPPISFSTRPLIITGTLSDHVLQPIVTPVTLQKVGAQWEYASGDIYWQAGFVGDVPFISYTNDFFASYYYATGLSAEDFPDGGITPLVDEGTGIATVEYAEVTLAPTGATATYDGRVWKNTGTDTVPEWLELTSLADVLAAIVAERTDTVTISNKTITDSFVASGSLDVTTATRTLGLSDVGKYLRFTNASGCIISLPSATPWPANAVIYGRRATGAGELSFSEAGGNTTPNDNAIADVPVGGSFAVKRNGVNTSWDFI